MRATRLLRCSAGKDKSTAEGFANQFNEMKSKMMQKIRGEDSSRMLDPNIYRPTPKYGELNLPSNCGPLNNTDEDFSYHPRQERYVREFTISLQICPEIPDGPEPYYARVYKPMTDVLKRIYPTEFEAPDLSVAEGNVVPIFTPPLSEDHDLDDPETCTWRLNPSHRQAEYAKEN